jgi:hypothetical protein
MAQYDTSRFDPKAPPPKTPAFWEMVEIGRVAERSDMADAVDAISGSDNRPNAITIAIVAEAIRNSDATPGNFYDWMTNRKNKKAVAHRLADCGYVPVRNPGATRWADGILPSCFTHTTHDPFRSDGGWGPPPSGVRREEVEGFSHLN